MAAAAAPGAPTPAQQLLDAAARGDAAAVAALLSSAGGADANAATASGRTPLHFAAEDGHVEVARLLLDAGADVNAATALGRTALHSAAHYCGSVDLVRLLLDRGADVNASTSLVPDSYHFSSCQPLHLAAACRHAEVVRLLLSHGADVRATATWRSATGVTPLHVCTAGQLVYGEMGDELEVARALLDAGAPIDAADSDGRRALHLAVAYDAYETAALLLARGADVHATDNAGATPLHAAREFWPSYDLVEPQHFIELLLEHGADARAVDLGGRTPLHSLGTRQRLDLYDAEGSIEAAEAKAYDSMVGALKGRGADVDAVDAEGRTPLMIALANDSPAAAALLRCGARVGPPECGRCAAAGELHANTQRVVVEMAGGAERLRHERTAWEQERAALQQERAALEAARSGSGGGGGARPQRKEPAAKRARGGG